MKKDLNTIVLIKQVPDAEDVKTDPETGRLIRDGAVTINPFDMFAIEEAILLKEKYGGTVTVLTMGPPNANFSLEFCLAMGADDAILLTDRAFAGADTIATSYALAQGIKKVEKYDIIFCGVKTTDGDTGQVGQDVAEFLDLPCIYYVDEIRNITETHITVKKQFEDSNASSSIRTSRRNFHDKRGKCSSIPNISRKNGSKKQINHELYCSRCGC